MGDVMKNIKWYLLDFMKFVIFVFLIVIFGTCAISSLIMLEMYISIHTFPCVKWFVLVAVTCFVLLPLVILIGRKCYEETESEV